MTAIRKVWGDTTERFGDPERVMKGWELGGRLDLLPESTR